MAAVSAGETNSATISSARSKANTLLQQLKQLSNVVVAYSGGVDSSLLAYYAKLALGEKAVIVIAVSPSLAEDELKFARQQAKDFGWQLVEVQTDEVEKSEYLLNDERRCYFCKSTLFETMERLASERGLLNLAYGANINDLSDYRPGHQAAREHRVLSPLQSADLNKEEIRALAREAKLPSWDRPQSACLSSRFPTHQPITVTKLSQVDRAESYLHSLGFRNVRVRHHDELARIEFGEAELQRIFDEPLLVSNMVSELKEIGFVYITLDLEGYRQGSSNLSAKSASIDQSGL